MVTPKALSVSELRSEFLRFFVGKGHTEVPSVPLVPQNDDSLLFVNSGMVPFKDVFKGLETRTYLTATTCQKSLRVAGKHNDFEQIGRSPRHHTFFEMLGNFSFGEYFKEKAIAYAWEFITKQLNLPKSHLWVSIHHSDNEAMNLWLKVTDIAPDRIVRLGDESNLWAMGETGPCGYSSEIFYYMGTNPDSQSVEEFLKDDGTYLEFWNLVFMQFNRDSSGELTPLPKPCIDTGMGLERMAAILSGKKSNYDTNNLRAIIKQIEHISGKQYGGAVYGDIDVHTDRQFAYDVAMRVIADHSRAAAFLIAEGVAPGNEGHNYVLRRLIRRAIRHGQELGLKDTFMKEVVGQVIAEMSDVYPELNTHKAIIEEYVTREEKQFQRTLNNGLAMIGQQSANMKKGDELPGRVAFMLYDTYGFPLDLTQEVMKDNGMIVDLKGFEVELQAQKERSRTSKLKKTSVSPSSAYQELKTPFLGYETVSADATLAEVLPYSQQDQVLLIFNKTPFYPEMGGQVGDTGTIVFDGTIFNVIDTQRLSDGRIAHITDIAEVAFSTHFAGKKAALRVDEKRREMIAVHHTSTHLLNAALKEVLGTHVQQRGSFISPDKLRFDFNHFEPLTQEQISAINEYINTQVRKCATVSVIELPIEEALKQGATAVFGEKYSAVVRVVEAGSSIEVCGGTHVSNTGEIGVVLLTSEGGISAGVRRIEATAGVGALVYANKGEEILQILGNDLRGSREQIPEKLNQLFERVKQLEHDNKEKDMFVARLLGHQLQTSAIIVNGVTTIGHIFDALSDELLRQSALQAIRTIKGSGIVAIGNRASGTIVVALTSNLLGKFHAGNLVQLLGQQFSVRGGGRADLAQLGGLSPGVVESSLEAFWQIVFPSGERRHYAKP